MAKYVARRRPEIEAARKGRAERLEEYVPRLREPEAEAEAEADFGPVTVGWTAGRRPATCSPTGFRARARESTRSMPHVRRRRYWKGVCTGPQRPRSLM